MLLRPDYQLLGEIAGDPRGFWRELTGDSHLRWIGPEKGVIHLATAALVNAVWDLWARAAGKPLWKLLVDMPAEELVGCVDFRYMTDALTPEQTVNLLESRSKGKPEREAEMRRDGVIEYVDELHEHFVDPAWIRDGRYTAPNAPGYSIEMHPETLEEYAFPGDRAWR